MLGLILYEAFDIVYHVGKLGVNGVYGAYKWYNSSSKNNNQENKQDNNEQNKNALSHKDNDIIHEKYMNKIKQLEESFTELEKKYNKIQETLELEKS